jgi:hypothetical protein
VQWLKYIFGQKNGRSNVVYAESKITINYEENLQFFCQALFKVADRCFVLILTAIIFSYIYKMYYLQTIAGKIHFEIHFLKK